MNYWLTIHWPEGGEPSGVYILDSRLDVAKDMAPGDFVFIYQTLKGGTPIGQMPGHQRGYGGVVALVQVTDKPSERKGSRPEKYKDRSERWWRYYAPTRTLSRGRIPCKKVATLLGYKEAYTFHSFGRGSGLKKLCPEQFEALRAVFENSAAE